MWLPRVSRGSCAGFVVVSGAIFRIAQQVVGGDEPLQLRVTGSAIGGGAARVGMNVPQLGAKRVIDLCSRGGRSHPQHGVGIVIFDHGNTTRGGERQATRWRSSWLRSTPAERREPTHLRKSLEPGSFRAQLRHCALAGKTRGLPPVLGTGGRLRRCNDAARGPFRICHCRWRCARRAHGRLRWARLHSARLVGTARITARSCAFSGHHLRCSTLARQVHFGLRGRPLSRPDSPSVGQRSTSRCPPPPSRRCRPFLLVDCSQGRDAEQAGPGGGHL